MKIEIYSKQNCSFCTFATNLLTSYNREFTQYKLDEHFSIDELKAEFPEAKSFPVVVIEDVFIGGYTELKQIIIPT